MPVDNQRRKADGQTNFIGGANSALDPSLINENQYSWGRNVSIRNGLPKTRPAFVHRLTLPVGRFQGASYFSKYDGGIVASIDGKIYDIDVQGESITLSDVTPASGRNSAFQQIAYFCETPSGMLIQDNQSRPILWNGSSSSRLGPDEVPVGGPTVYGNGRVWVAVADELFAGDIYDGLPRSELKFTENDYLTEGGSFIMPEEITGMAFMPRLDNTTDTGDLIVFTKQTTNTIRATVFDRNLWKVTPGMQKLLFPSIGCASQRSIAAVNQDLYFLAYDGIRSLRNTFSDQQDEGNTPISREVARIMDYDTDRWKKFQSGVYFNNRYILGGNPFVQYAPTDVEERPTYNIVCNTMISLDFAPIASMGKEFGKSFDGEWTGIHVMQYVSGTFLGKNRLFAFATDNFGGIQLFEIVDTANFDEFYGRKRIPCSLEFRSMDGQSPYDYKTLWSFEFWMSNIIGNLDWELFYRPDNSPCWNTWQTGGTCFKFEDCDPPAACQNTASYQPGYITKFITKKPSQGPCQSWVGRNPNHGTEFQIRFDWTGQATFNRCRLFMDEQDNKDTGICT